MFKKRFPHLVWHDAYLVPRILGKKHCRNVESFCLVKLKWRELKRFRKLLLWGMKIWQNLATGSIWLGGNRYQIKLCVCQNPLWVWSHLKSDFFLENFTKLDLALKKVIKNRSKVTYGCSLVFLTILPMFFFQKSYGNTTLFFCFFNTERKISYVRGALGGIKIENCFRTIKDLPII